MSRMTSRSTKGGPPTTPSNIVTTSSIRPFMTKGVSPQTQGTQGGTKQQQPNREQKSVNKKPQGGNTSETSIESREESNIEHGPEGRGNKEHRSDIQPPLNGEIAEMLRRMETAIKEEIKGEIQNLRTDLGHFRTRIVTIEERTETVEQEVKGIKDQIDQTQRQQRLILYKIEDQENRNRRQNLRIRSIPEERGEDLRKIMRKIFNPLLEKPIEDPIRIERVHRVGNPQRANAERTRDVIVRFRLYEDKEKVWKKLRGQSPIVFEGIELQIFSDLSAETLARRRALKPLLKQMIDLNIKYTWGHPACLIGTKDGRSTILKFPEDLDCLLYTSPSPRDS